MQVVILCGGRGTRFKEETDLKPKPMIEIGGMPILWHIMKTYAYYGFNEFILCLGYKGDVIKQYFYDYEILANDFTIELGTKNIELFTRHGEHGWKITLVDTGLNAMTGARVRKIEPFIKGNTFMLTYGDGLTNLNINELIEFHRSHGKVGTVSGVYPQSRYGELTIENDRVLSFSEKPAKATSINGGYFVFNKEIFRYIDPSDDCILEREPFQRLVADNQFNVFSHTGFWQCMDTYRDYTFLQDLWDKGDAPWVKK